LLLPVHSRTLEHEARRGNRSSVKQYSWLDTKLAISIEQPVPSPQVYEYRNKVEFTAGYRNVIVETGDANESNGDKKSDETSETPSNIRKIPAAGFLASGWAGGVTSPHCLQNTPDWACSIADILNEYLPTSPLKPYDSKIHRGFFRSFTIRCSLRTREIMVIVVHAPAKGGVGAAEDGSDDFSAVFEEEKTKLVELLTRDVLAVPKRDFPADFVREEIVDGQGCDGLKVTSVFFQEFDGLSQPGPDHPVQVRFPCFKYYDAFL
jgi:tRNA (uracil-5-)-methyltransferase